MTEDAVVALPPPELAKAYRVSSGLSREALARRIPCSTRTVFAWEEGRSAPTGLLRQRYIEVLRELRDIPPAWWGGAA